VHLDYDAGMFGYWGDGDTPMDLTASDDVAHYAIEVALDPRWRIRLCRSPATC